MIAEYAATDVHGSPTGTRTSECSASECPARPSPGAILTYFDSATLSVTLTGLAVIAAGIMAVVYRLPADEWRYPSLLENYRSDASACVDRPVTLPCF